MKTSYQKFTEDILIIAIADFVLAISALVLLPLLTKTLGAHDYGIWAQVRVTIGLVLGFVHLGLPFAMVRFLAAKINKDEIQEEFYSVFCTVFLTTFVISTVLIIFANSIAEAFFDGATHIVTITGLITLVWSLDLVLLSLFRTFRQMKSYAIFTIADTCGQIGLIAYLVLNGYGLLSAVLSVLVIKSLIFLVLFFLVKSQIGIKRPHFSRIKEYLDFGLPTIAGNMASWTVASSDRYVIAYFLGPASVGVYSAGYVLGGSIIMMFAGVLGFVLPPALSQLYDEGRMNEVRTHLSYSLKYTLALAIPFVFGAGVLAEPVLKLFSTAEIAGEGYFVVPLIALSTSFYSVYVVVAHILIVVKKTRIMGLSWLIAAVVNLGLNILIVPWLGILGACLTTLIAYTLAFGIGGYYSFKEFKFSTDWRFIIKSLIASAIMSLAIWPMHPQSSLATIIAVLLGVAVYGAALFLLKGVTKKEIRFFRGLLQRSTSEGNSDDKAR